MLRRLTCALYLLIISCTTYSQQQAADAMFRGNATHNFFIPADTTKTFTKRAWQFQTGAAIRSTAVCNDRFVFIGSSDGYLYALDQQNGRLAWKYNCGSAVTASPAYSKGVVYISSLNQNLFAIEAATGKLLYSKSIGANPPYDWGFDYYSSSPVVKEDTLFIAAADGTINALSKQDGKILWSNKPGGFVRSTPAVANGILYVGDTKGILYALESKSGKQIWSYKTKGADFNNVQFGFDRNAIISSPTVTDSLVLFGSRDGFLYVLDAFGGQLKWTYDYKVSWVISTPVVVQGKVIVGTSDGQFIHALDEHTGTELWRAKTGAPVWSSALVVGNCIYMPCNDGVLYCIDIVTGVAKPHPFVTGSKMFTSAVVAGALLFFGADNGSFYCLKQEPAISIAWQHFVYWDKPLQYDATRFTPALAVRRFMNLKGYKLLDATQLLAMAKSDTVYKAVMVMAAEFLPSAYWKKDSAGNTFPLQRFMEEGNTVVSLGFNSLAIDFDDTTGFYKAFNFKRAAQLLGVQYSENDLRSLNGFNPAMATTAGLAMGMKPQFIAACPLTDNNVDAVLGKDERNRVVAFIKRVGNKGGAYIQLSINRDFIEDYEFIDEVIKHFENG